MSVKTARIILTVLLIIPIAATVDAVIHPFIYNDLREICYPPLAIPILFLAYCAWEQPAVIKDMFNLKGDSMAPSTTPSQGNRIIITIVGIGLGIIIFCCFCAIGINFVQSIGNRSKSASPTQTLDVNAIQTAAVQTAMAALTPINSIPQTVAPPATGIPATQPPLPTNTQLPQPPTSMGGINDRIEHDGIALTALAVSKINSINDFMKAKEGYTYLVVEVIIENASRVEETPYNPLYFSVKDSSGFEYRSSIVAPDTALTSGKLPKGDKVRGNVAFEVKTQADGFILSYEPLVILGGYTPIRISLSQSSAAPCSCSSNIMDCSNFDTHATAQTCFDYCKSQGAGDIHELDADGNGLACEQLP
jgi:hypothetical protein